MACIALRAETRAWRSRLISEITSDSRAPANVRLEAVRETEKIASTLPKPERMQAGSEGGYAGNVDAGAMRKVRIAKRPTRREPCKPLIFATKFWWVVQGLNL